MNKLKKLLFVFWWIRSTLRTRSFWSTCKCIFCIRIDTNVFWNVPMCYWFWLNSIINFASMIGCSFFAKVHAVVNWQHNLAVELDTYVKKYSRLRQPLQQKFSSLFKAEPVYEGRLKVILLLQVTTWHDFEPAFIIFCLNWRILSAQPK